VYENIARDLNASCLNQKIVECCLVINSKNSWLGYTPNGVNNTNVPIILIEIKYPLNGKSLSIRDLILKLNCIIRYSDGSLGLKKKNHSY